MAFYRLPGPLCVMGALPVDSGTLVRASTPSPGPLLTTDENGFIQNFTGLDEDGNPLPLATLHHWYDQFVQLHKEAARQFGVQSGSARRTQATVERLAALIAQEESPRGKSADKLRRLLEPGNQATDEELSQGVADVLAAERQMQLRGLSDEPGTATAMDLVAEVSQVVSARKQAEARKVLEDAQRPGSQVTDEQLRKVATDMLSAERQRQLLGAPGDDSAGVSAVLGDLIKVDNDRRKKRLKDQIEEAKGADGKITPEKLEKLQTAVQEMLGSERQKQLLGVEDEGATGASAMELLSQAVDISYESHKADLKRIIEDTKRPGNTMTRTEISKAIANVLGDARSRQLMGVSGDKADQELSDLLEKAAEAAGEREKPASSSPKEKRISVTAGPIQLIRRVPFRR